jgi:hypothetical protein
MLEDNDRVKEILARWGKEVISDMIEILRNSNAYASGKLASSLSFEFREDAGILSLDLKGAPYLEYVLNGRRTGGQPPLSAIQKWTQMKGLPEEAAYPIARKIGRFGIKPFPTLISPFYKRQNELKDLLTKEYTQTVSNDTIQLLKKIALK